ncbi:MAG: o-succinylbenzoate--CoA ligase [Homoserinimonas sp.]|jgi:O-succinylbenzoic acid--CoA ligase|nr:o-succinylbenzoate--CoA ligase [Homoserinimonas sp.]
MRELRIVDASDPAAVMQTLAGALAGGPAILPHVGVPTDVPAAVQQRVALIIETSGSTGKPKRVMLSADALLASAAASESALGGPGQWLLALPAHYIAGVNVLVRSLASGTEPALVAAGRFDPFAFAVAAGTMDGERRFTALVPAQLSRLLQEDDVLETLRSFDRILVGGQSMPDSLLARSLELGLNVTCTYGSSETSGGCVYDGVPLSGVGVRVSDGEIELNGPTLADGYLGDPQKTEARFQESDGQRWYRTGDTGTVIDGVLTVTGRLDDVIISGGIKVSIAAVEHVVAGFVGVSSVVVVPAGSAEWGQVPVVVATTGVDLDSLRSAVEVVLGKAARPHRVVVVAEIPLLASGKPDRQALRELAER